MSSTSSINGLQVDGGSRSPLLLLAAGFLLAACAGPPRSPAAPSSRVYDIAVIASSVNALPKCTSALTGTTAYVQSPVSLYSCQAPGGRRRLLPSVAPGHVPHRGLRPADVC